MRFAGVVYWVQLRPDLEAFEHPLLDGGRRSQHIEDTLTHSHSVPREGCQVCQQTSETVHQATHQWFACGWPLFGCLGAVCRRYDAGALRLRCLVVLRRRITAAPDSGAYG